MNIHRSAHVQDTRREQRKEATTHSGATAPTERHCADQARHTKREQDKISILRGSQNIPLDCNHHKTCLKHSSFLNRKLCPIVTHMEHHGNSKGTGNRRKNKRRQKRVETRFKTRQLQQKNRLYRKDGKYEKLLDRESLGAEDGVKYFWLKLRPHLVKGAYTFFL